MMMDELLDLDNPNLTHFTTQRRSFPFLSCTMQLDTKTLSAEERARRGSAHYNASDFNELAGRFSREEVNGLCEGFEKLDEKLKLEEEQVWHASQDIRTHYDLNNMPVDFEVEDFIASWNS